MSSMFLLALAAAAACVMATVLAVMLRGRSSFSARKWGGEESGKVFTSVDVTESAGWAAMSKVANRGNKLETALNSPVVNVDGLTPASLYVKAIISASLGAFVGLLVGAYQGTEGFATYELSAMLGPAVAFMLVGALAGSLLPFGRVISAQNKHVRFVVASMPTLNLLIARTISSGVSPAGAPASVIPYLSETNVRAEIQLVVHQLNNGISVSEAMENFAARCPHPAVRSFALLMIDAHAHGSDLVEVFEHEARELREAATRDIEARAGKASSAVVILLLVGLVTALFPFLFSIYQGIGDTGGVI